MVRDQALTDRLRALPAELTSLTVLGTLGWERQLHSAHRYAKWKNNLLILGPTAPLDDHAIPRYLFLTPLTLPIATEITSADAELRELRVVNMAQSAPMPISGASSPTSCRSS